MSDKQMAMKKPIQYLILGLGKTGLSCARFLTRQKQAFAIIDNRACPPMLEEFKKEFPNINISLGSFADPLIEQAETLIASPGLALSEPAIVKAKQRGAKIIGDIELFAQHVKAPVIGITGTNAKGTVTTLVGNMIKQAGLNVLVGGNIGTPALDLLQEPTPDYYVLEISSFQLETTYSLKTRAATILNLTADHLDRHGTMENYQKAKQEIYRHCHTAIFNRDNDWTKPLLATSQQISFGLDEPKENQFGLRNKHLALGNQHLIAVDELKIRGTHNWANALAALALGHSISLPMNTMLLALKEFKGLHHRCEWVTESNGVTWYNDSKGTNVGATLAALEGLGPTIPGKIILLAGGLSKGADFHPLKSAINQFTRAVILFGKDAPLISAAIKDAAPIHFTKTFDAAIKLAKDTAQSGDVVLLSPACASFDMFRDYEERGEIFAACVKEIT